MCMQKHTNICKDRYESTFFGNNLIVYCIIRVLISASYFYINTVLYSVTIFLFFFFFLTISRITFQSINQKAGSHTDVLQHFQCFKLNGRFFFFFSDL